MFKISIETNNNPSILKFVANSILTEGSFEYNTIEDADNSELVQQLFHLPFIKKVFVTANFIAIERYNIVEWEDVQEELQQVVENYLNKNGSLFNTSGKSKKMPVQIYAESTPNPNVMKFVTNKLLSSQNIEIKSPEETKGVPIATSLFSLPFVKEVFISENYVSISKSENIDWLEITTELRTFLKHYIEEGKPIIDQNYFSLPFVKEVFISENYVSISKSENMDWLEITTELRTFLKHYIEEGKPIIDQNYEPIPHHSKLDTPINVENLDDISKEIVAILDEYIKPAVTSDGGNIMFQSYDADNKIVNVILQGACSGCPSSTITLKNGIEATLKQLLPNKIEEVIAING